jgi:hypothetical protein
MKADPFTNNTTLTGRTGNWAARHKVGWKGNVFTNDTSLSGGPTVNGTGWLGEGWAADALTVTGVVPTWKSNLSGQGGTGQGDYRLGASEANLVGKVPANMAGLSYDLAGAVRYNDGLGAAGAYERDPPPVAGAGGGTIGTVGETGAGQTAPIGVSGGGGGAVGTVGGAGTGAVIGAPIVATGAIIASADRTLAVSPIPSGTSGSASLPLAASVWAAPFDPADRAPYAIDWTKLLAVGETIVQIDRITMSAEGASLGLQVDTSATRTPIISTDGKKTQVWFLCTAGFQSNAAFAGGGVQVGLSVLIRTSADPYKQFERTGVLIVRQQ